MLAYPLPEKTSRRLVAELAQRRVVADEPRPRPGADVIHPQRPRADHHPSCCGPVRPPASCSLFALDHLALLDEEPDVGGDPPFEAGAELGGQGGGVGRVIRRTDDGDFNGVAVDRHLCD